MTIQIVSTEGVSAPKDGTIFNAQYSDGTVTKVRWTHADWEGAMSDGRWRGLEYLRGRTPPVTWWPATVADCEAELERAWRSLEDARAQRIPPDEMAIYHARVTACRDALATAKARVAKPPAASFDVDEHTAELLARLQKTFGVVTNAAVIRKALALASIASEQAGDGKTVTIAGEGKAPVKVALVD